MPELISEDDVRQLVNLLVKEFGSAVDRTVIASYVSESVRDLRGSICPEALPEMACRLAGHRLGELVLERQSGDLFLMQMATTTTARKGRVG